MVMNIYPRIVIILLKFEMKYISIINTKIYTKPAVVNSNAIYNMVLSILFSTVRLAI